MDRYTELFLEEAGEHIETLNDVLLKLEQEGTKPDLLNELFRIAHTLKSSAGFVGLDHLARLAHHMEDLLQQVRDGSRVMDAALVNLLFRCLDRISATVHSVAKGEKPDDDFAELIREVSQLAGTGAAPADSGAPAGTSAPFAGEGDAALGPSGAAESSAAEHDLAGSSGDESQIEGEAAESTGAQIHLTAEQERKLQALSAGRHVYEGLVSLDPEAPMRHIRFLLLVQNLNRSGELFWSNPSLAELEEGAATERLQFVLVTEASRTEIAAACRIDMVQDVLVSEHHEGGASAVSAVQQAAEETRLQTKNIKVSADKIDFLMNNVGEMVITNSGLQKIYEDLVGDLGEDAALSELKSRIDGAARIARDLQTGIMKMRMIPVGLVFHRFTRPVRDLSAELGKEVALVFSGDETELDKNIIDALPDPLLHLLRNSLDHGIEDPEARAAAGKPRQARLALNAYQGGNNIFIEIRDDGRGLDAQKILNRARSNGLVPEDYTPAGDEEVLDFIFHPGFSTADKVSDLSGRGVGMNVVRTMVQRFNGTIRIRNEPGKGCAFVLSFPLTLAIISAILVRVGTEEYAVPLSDVIENIRIRTDEITTLEGRQIYNLRGDILPVHDLATLLGAPAQTGDQEEVPVVVAAAQDRKYGFVVSGFTGKKEIVIKSLEQNYRTIRGLIGVCLMGDGRIVPVLDIQGLLSIAHGEERRIGHSDNMAAVEAYNRTVQEMVSARSSKQVRRRAPVRALAGVGAATERDAVDERDGRTANRPPPMRPLPAAPAEEDAEEVQSFDRHDAAPLSEEPGSASADSASSDTLSEQDLSAALERLREDREERQQEGRSVLTEGVSLPTTIDRGSFEKLYEIINAGMMNAGLVLSQLLGISIEVTVPEARTVDTHELSEFVPSQKVISVWLEGAGELAMDLMLVFDERNGYAAAGELMGLPAAEWNAEHIAVQDLESVLSELTNIVGSSIFNAIANRSGVESHPSVPQFSQETSEELVARFLERHSTKDYRIIYISTDFYREDMELVGRLFLFLPRASVGLISEKL